MISLAFTYTRACFLAFFAGIAVLAFLKKKFKGLLGILIGLIAIILILPTAGNLSNKLTRTFSINARFLNYKEAITIFKKHPLTGVGYNNFCIARNMYIGEEDFSSHACSGSDSSLLLILGTTGIVGLMVFIGMILKIEPFLKRDGYGILLSAALVSVAIHSLFSNSMFYPFILGYIAILLGTALKD